MRAVTNVTFGREDREVIAEAALAIHVGDADGDRIVTPFTALAGDRSALSQQQLERAMSVYLEVRECVDREADPAYWAAQMPALGKVADETPGVAVLPKPAEMAEVIMEARRKMQRDLDAAEALLDAALAEVTE